MRVINTRKKAFSVVPKASPWCQNHLHICALRHSGESLQNGQLELRRQSWYLAWETDKDTAASVWACQAGFWKSTRTSCQQQTCQNWQYGLVIKPFSSPQMIMYRLAFCIVMSRLKCLVWSMFFVVAFSLCRFIKYDWSMTELQWSWISHFSVYHDRNYILFPRLE